MFDYAGWEDYEADFSERDRIASENWAFLAEHMPWMTDREVNTMCKKEEFRDIPYTDTARLLEYVQTMERQSARTIRCSIRMKGFSVVGWVNLVTGSLFLGHAGHAVPFDLEGPAMLDFAGRKMLSIPTTIVKSKATHMADYQVKALVSQLEQERLLAPL